MQRTQTEGRLPDPEGRTVEFNALVGVNLRLPLERQATRPRLPIHFAAPLPTSIQLAFAPASPVPHAQAASRGVPAVPTIVPPTDASHSPRS